MWLYEWDHGRHADADENRGGTYTATVGALPDCGVGGRLKLLDIVIQYVSMTTMGIGRNQNIIILTNNDA